MDELYEFGVPLEASTSAQVAGLHQAGVQGARAATLCAAAHRRALRCRRCCGARALRPTPAANLQARGRPVSPLRPPRSPRAPCRPAARCRMQSRCQQQRDATAGARRPLAEPPLVKVGDAAMADVGLYDDLYDEEGGAGETLLRAQLAEVGPAACGGGRWHAGALAARCAACCAGLRCRKLLRGSRACACQPASGRCLRRVQGSASTACKAHLPPAGPPALQLEERTQQQEEQIERLQQQVEELSQQVGVLDRMCWRVCVKEVRGHWCRLLAGLLPCAAAATAAWQTPSAIRSHALMPPCPTSPAHLCRQQQWRQFFLRFISPPAPPPAERRAGAAARCAGHQHLLALQDRQAGAAAQGRRNPGAARAVGAGRLWVVGGAGRLWALGAGRCLEGCCGWLVGGFGLWLGGTGRCWEAPDGALGCAGRLWAVDGRLWAVFGWADAPPQRRIY